MYILVFIGQMQKDRWSMTDTVYHFYLAAVLWFSEADQFTNTREAREEEKEKMPSTLSFALQHLTTQY